MVLTGPRTAIDPFTPRRGLNAFGRRAGGGAGDVIFASAVAETAGADSMLFIDAAGAVTQGAAITSSSNARNLVITARGGVVLNSAADSLNGVSIDITSTDGDVSVGGSNSYSMNSTAAVGIVDLALVARGLNVNGAIQGTTVTFSTINANRNLDAGADIDAATIIVDTGMARPSPTARR